MTYIKTILSTLMGMVFLLSSITKAMALYVFADEVALYLDIYFWGWMMEYSMFVAAMVCLVEFLIGIAHIVPRFCHYANIAAFVALTFFVYLTGFNYLAPPMGVQIETCGCFGELIHFTPLGSFVKSCVLWVMSITIILCETIIFRKKVLRIGLP